MGDDGNPPRRKFLKTATAASLVGLAGCSGGGGGTPTTTSGGSDGSGSGSGSPTETSVVKDELEEIEFAFLAGASSGIVTQIMKAEGIDAKHDLHVDFRKMGLNEAQQALYRGQVETSSVGPIPTARANAKSGVDITIIAPVIQNHHSFLVKPDSPYQKLKDLLDERIATFPRSSSSYNTYAMLMNEKGHSWEDDFKLTLTSTINILNLFDRGDVEGMTHFEPFATRWLAPNKARELINIRDLYSEVFDRPQQFASIAAQTELVKNEPSKIIKMHRSYMDTLKFIRENIDQVLDRFGKSLYSLDTKAKLELGKKRIPPIYLPRWDDTVIESGKADIRKSREMGLLTKDAPTDIFWRPPSGV